MYPEAPSFVKKYADIGSAATAALREFAEDVKEKRFPE
jgi:ketopantoate hydroxymethyltransferase